MNTIEFKLHFTLDKEKGRYIPIVSLYNLEANRVISTKSFQMVADAEFYKRLASVLEVLSREVASYARKS